MTTLTKENTVILLSYDENSLKEIEPGIKVSGAWNIGKSRISTLEYVGLVRSQSQDSYEFGKVIGHYRINDEKIAIVFRPIDGPVITKDDHKHKNWPGFSGQKKYIEFHPQH
jgi:hypothetical protein